MMKKIMVILFSFIVVAAMISVFSCSSSNPEEPQATNTPVPPTSTPTIVPTVGQPALYSFDTDQTGDWTVEVNELPSTPTYNTEDGHTAPGCLQVTGDFSSPGAQVTIKHYIGTATDFTGKKITCWINVPNELVDTQHPYGVQIFVQDNTWGWDSQWINITASGWQKYEWTLPQSLSQDITKIVQVGIQISAGTGSPTVEGPVTILFDDINW